MSFFRYRSIASLLLIALALSACNMPGQSTSTQSAASYIYTAAAETVQAQLTAVSRPPATAAGQTPIPQSSASAATPAPGSTTPAPAGATSAPAGSPTPGPCDRMKLLQDVTYPDNTQVDPGAVFTKTWQLQNTGSCSWSSAYSIVFTGGDAMGAPASAPLSSGAVAPGEKVNVSLVLKAPGSSGTYRGEFKLRNASNIVFGIGTDNKPFWVQVKVPGTTGVIYDFVIQAATATWTSASSNLPAATLNFGGAEDDPNGVAKLRDQATLETGATSGKILLTVPKHENTGVISGVFSEYTVQAGDHLKARLGFLKNPDGACGAGKVRFQVSYKDDGGVRLIQEWSKTCSGSLLPVDLDLAGLKGKKVQFVLSVVADGTAQDNWTIWNSPRIER
ncbi:MAG TPA: NBR1-Ig-like domain-containing protein [Anaerolineales bacterium]